MKEGSPSTTAINSAMVRASHLLLDAEPKIFRDDFALALSGVGDEAALRAALDKRDEPLAREFGRDFAEFFCGHPQIEYDDAQPLHRGGTRIGLTVR